MLTASLSNQADIQVLAVNLKRCAGEAFHRRHEMAAGGGRGVDPGFTGNQRGKRR
jgi:hypothetical protein